MSGRPSDHANLDLTVLNEAVAFGQAGGLVIWQPRIGCWFSDRAFRREPLPAPYTGLSQPDIWRALGCSNRLYHFNACFERVEPATVTRRTETLGGGRAAQVVETPVGRMSLVVHSSPNNWHHITDKRWVATREELGVARWLAEHSSWRWRQDVYERLAREWAGLGAPTAYLPRVNVQDLYINLMGVEPAIYALYEWRDAVRDYFRVLHEDHLRLIEVVNASPIRLINFGDNLHSATLSPRLYEEYVLPAYRERCDRLHRAGKFISSHWDGDTKTLLRYARGSGLDAIEAITPRPQGDVTLEEVKAALGDGIALLDGIPAIYFDPAWPVETLVACTQQVLKLFAPKLILGISDEICSTGELERIRVVGRLVDDYNASMAARSGGVPAALQKK